MKIVNRKDFLQMPANTLFSKFSPDNFGPLSIKVCDSNDGWHNDFVVQDIEGAIQCEGSDDFSNKCDLMVKGEEVAMDFECAGRDGLFNNDQLFAVWSKDDVKMLIDRLNKCL